MPRSRTHAERLAARDGYFRPEGMVRRLGNSAVTPFLGGGAHPPGARLRREHGLRWSALHELAVPFAGRAVRYGPPRC